MEEQVREPKSELEIKALARRILVIDSVKLAPDYNGRVYDVEYRVIWPEEDIEYTPYRAARAATDELEALSSLYRVWEGHFRNDYSGWLAAAKRETNNERAGKLVDIKV